VVVNIPGFVAALLAILGFVGTVAAAIAVIRQKGIEQSQQTMERSLDVLSKANAELRLANDDLHKELQTERLERAKLEGKLEVFTDSFAQKILDAVIETIKRVQPNIALATPTRSPLERTRTGDTP